MPAPGGCGVPSMRLYIHTASGVTIGDRAQVQPSDKVNAPDFKPPSSDND